MTQRDLLQFNDLWDEAMAAQQFPPAKGAEYHDKAAIACLEQWLPRIEKEAGLGLTVLDVGCGRGYLRVWFMNRGWFYENVDVQGEPTYKQDFHFDPSDYAIPKYVLVFARHVVEHSPMPILAVARLYGFTQGGGWCILVTLKPPFHSDLADHLSVMGRAMWSNLVRRVGFEIIDADEAGVGDGSTEMRFLLRREIDKG